jgi:hypothetical protein
MIAGLPMGPQRLLVGMPGGVFLFFRNRELASSGELKGGDKMKLLKLNVCILLFLSMILFAACSDPSSSGDTGTLSLSLTDASTQDYKAVYVTIDEIKVHSNGEDNWIAVDTPKKTYNLLDLINGEMEILGEANLEPGVYTQMRLYLGTEHDQETNKLGEIHPHANYVIDAEGNTVHELKIPSGYRTGVKLVHKFEIVAGRTVDLVLDFDACASVVKAGKNGQHLLKPTIKITDAVNNAIVNGIVFDARQTGLEGATVSAQIYTQSESDANDRVSVFTSTITTGNDRNNTAGAYLMYLPPGTYTLVAYTPGFMPAHTTITTALDDVLTIDFPLTPATSSETVSGTVTIDASSKSAEADGQSVFISFRQAYGSDEDGSDVEGSEGVIEVVSLNLSLEEGKNDYGISLPEGEYRVVATTAEMEAFEDTITVVAGTPVTLDINFPITPVFSPRPI